MFLGNSLKKFWCLKMRLLFSGSKIVVLIVTFVFFECEGSNDEFNERIRDFAAIDNTNSTHMRTLQKQGIGLSSYASSAPVLNPVKFKDARDSALSGSSHSRGLLHHDYNGYGYTDYDDPHFGHDFEYSIPDHHYGNGLHSVGHHISGHHLGHGHHFKHYDHHGLAAKSLLLPIAGIALLGAAAALATNPVLLQLGVISGRRKRRQTDTSNFVRDSIIKWSQKQKDAEEEPSPNMLIKKRVLRKTDLLKDNNLDKPKQIIRKPKNVQSTYFSSNFRDSERNFVPIPLKFKNQ